MLPKAVLLRSRGAGLVDGGVIYVGIGFEVVDQRLVLACWHDPLSLSLSVSFSIYLSLSLSGMAGFGVMCTSLF